MQKKIDGVALTYGSIVSWSPTVVSTLADTKKLGNHVLQLSVVSVPDCCIGFPMSVSGTPIYETLRHRECFI